jgi:serine/threonine-protein phosphatase 2A regulatory subunit B''
MQKQTEQLLNADDLDTMWVCLRENCVVDDATGAEKVSSVNFFYENGSCQCLPLMFCGSK